MSSTHALARGDVDVKAKDEWTIMIFFAGDPHLSPSMTAQLKALKDAGFQDKTTVLVHYDPNERGVGTTTFEINRERKAQIKSTGDKGTRIGDGKDPFVRNLLEDSIPGGVPKSATAVDALRAFLINGLRHHEAEHYVIFLVGHGVIVGNDFFLPDRQPESAITLQQLGEVLSEFKNGAKIFGGEVELIGLHSCSMSAIEVAYQLKGAARYLMATEGISFVSSWPYRQFLKKMLNTIDLADKNGTKVDVDGLVNSLQQLGVHNTKDFVFSGLSADLCLCSLEPKRIDDLTEPIQKLSKALKDGLKDHRGLELITLAHLKSQSYWQETYTDLYDFCLCLEKQCDKEKGDPIRDAMAAACKDVRKKLEESPKGVVVQSDYFGPLFQYSHGLSIFFPWAEPFDDVPLTAGDDMLGRYQKYAFTTELKTDSWLSFLKEYFKATRRDSRQKEDKPQVPTNGAKVKANVTQTATVNTVIVANGGGGNGGGNGGESLEPEKTSPALAPEKTSPALAMGCTCSVKNYPMEFLLSQRASHDYQQDGKASESKSEASTGANTVATARVK
jgi:hypothetical protein